MKRDIHRISMIEPQSIMYGRLTMSTDGQATAEGLKKEILNLRRVADKPDSIAVEANKRTGITVAIRR